MNNKDLSLHVAALQSLVMGMMVRMAETDLEGLREILDDPAIRDPESLPELAHYSARDRARLKRTLDRITGPLRTAVMPPASRA